MLNLLILLQAEAPKLASEPEQSSFWFWFICEAFGGAFVSNDTINPVLTVLALLVN